MASVLQPGEAASTGPGNPVRAPDPLRDGSVLCSQETNSDTCTGSCVRPLRRKLVTLSIKIGIFTTVVYRSNDTSIQIGTYPCLSLKETSECRVGARTVRTSQVDFRMKRDGSLPFCWRAYQLIKPVSKFQIYEFIITKNIMCAWPPPKNSNAQKLFVKE